jgi:hypothetical protein
LESYPQVIHRRGDIHISTGYPQIYPQAKVIHISTGYPQIYPQGHFSQGSAGHGLVAPHTPCRVALCVYNSITRSNVNLFIAEKNLKKNEKRY